MIYGLQAAADTKLSSITRSLNELIPLIKTEDRLSRNVDDLEAYLQEARAFKSQTDQLFKVIDTVSAHLGNKGIYALDRSRHITPRPRRKALQDG